MEAEQCRQAAHKQAQNVCEQSKSPLHDCTAQKADAKLEQTEQMEIYDNFVLVVRLELAEARHPREAALADGYATQKAEASIE